MPVWWKTVRGDEENIGPQFNLCVIDSGKRKGPGPSPVCGVFMLNLSLRLADKVLYSSFWKEHIWRSPCGICNILPRKEASLLNCQILKPVIGIKKLETGPGLFSPTAAFAEIVYTFLYSKCHFHFHFSAQEGSCPLLVHVQPALDISQLHILPNTKLLKQSGLGWCEWCSWFCFPNCSKATTDSMGTKGAFKKLSVFQLCFPNESFLALRFPFFKVQVFTYSHCYHLFLLLLAHT